MSKIWVRNFKTFASPALGRKSLKSVVEGMQNYLPARGAHMSRPVSRTSTAKIRHDDAVQSLI